MRAWIAGLAMMGLIVAFSGCGGEQQEKKPKWAQGNAHPTPVAETPKAVEEKPPEPKPEPAPEAKPEPEPEQPQQMPEGVVLAGTEQTFDPKLPQSDSMTKLKQIAVGMRLFQALSKDKVLPPHAIYDLDDKQALLSWRVLLLAHVGQGKLFKQFHLDEPWDGPHNQKLLAQMPQLYQTPGITKEGYTAYVVPRGQGTIFAQHKSLADSLIGDGLDKTILVLETTDEKAVPWTKPDDFTFIPAKPSAGLTKEGKTDFLAAMANSFVYKIPLSLDDDFLRGLFTANGHEAINMAVLADKPEGPGGEKAHSGPLGEAEQALAKDNAREALAPLYVEAIARGNPDVLNTLRWSPGLKRSMLMLRVGLGVQVPGGVAAQAGEQAAQGWNEQIGKPMQEKLRARMAKGGFGRWLQLTPAASQAPGMDQPPPVDPNNPDAIKIGTGGIVNLGAGEIPQLRKTAVKEGIDVLVHVNITGHFLRGRDQFQSVLAVKVLDVAKNEVLWTSKTINAALPPGIPVPRARTGLKVEDSPERQAKSLLSEFNNLFNEKIGLTDMPELTADELHERVDMLSDSPSSNPLPALAELRYYEFKKLITRDDLAKAFSKIVGDENGPRLATGNEVQRRQILAKWVNKE